MSTRDGDEISVVVSSTNTWINDTGEVVHVCVWVMRIARRPTRQVLRGEGGKFKCTYVNGKIY